MRELIAYARTRDIGTLVGDVLAENSAMLALARELGFTAETEDSGIVRVKLPLTSPVAPVRPEDIA
jgi:acetyltransferase